MHQLLLLYMLLCSFCIKGSYFDFTTRNQDIEERIFYSAPAELDQEILLIPAFDTLQMAKHATPERMAYVQKVNMAAKGANATLKEVIEGIYPYKYQLVSLKEVKTWEEKGIRYFLDLVLMPKQMQQLKMEALIPSYEKHTTANKMYRNNNLQFHYYFYIRDLQNGDIYAGTKPKGNAAVYKGIDKFLKQIIKDL